MERVTLATSLCRLHDPATLKQPGEKGKLALVTWLGSGVAWQEELVLGHAPVEVPHDSAGGRGTCLEQGKMV